jgi:hypothetical protein
MTMGTRLSPNIPSAQIPFVDCGGRHKSQDKEALEKNCEVRKKSAFDWPHPIWIFMLILRCGKCKGIRSRHSIIQLQFYPVTKTER